MKCGIFMTVFDRPHYLRSVVESWNQVRGLENWPFHVFLEPSAQLHEMVSILEDLNVKDLRIHFNDRIHGVLHNPWVGFEEMFKEFDFVVRSEDDLIVSDDILEYFEWAANRPDPRVFAALGYTDGSGPENEVQLLREFNPWVWGTWRFTWEEVIGPTWDHDYSTFNGAPGNQSGWDWNLNTRIYPEHGASSLVPSASRVSNIGIDGVHGNASNFRTSSSFQAHREPTSYQYRR